MSHTPGPWHVDTQHPTVVRPGNETHPRRAAIAQTGLSHGIGEAGDEDRANARLIAAAPDLLAALEEILGPGDLILDEAIRHASEAVKKARGE